ncbi:MAG: hypothetical protein PHP83_01800 [Clostridia bacterium]|nr:hypothetical protein [Clostridia bacterium]
MSTILYNIANSFMSLSSGSLAATPDWVLEIVRVLKSIVSPALIIVSAAGAIYSIVLGVKMAQADDQSKRDEAKKNLINVIIAVVATVLLIVLFYMLGEWIGTDNFPV